MRKRHKEIKFYNSITYRNRVRKRSEKDIIVKSIAKDMVRVINGVKRICDNIDSVIDSIFKEPEYEEHDAMGIKYLVRR